MTLQHQTNLAEPTAKPTAKPGFRKISQDLVRFDRIKQDLGQILQNFAGFGSIGVILQDLIDLGQH